ncbi:ECF RNA polymerase sigma factor SigH [Microbulbifer sp. NBRC 101763]|uniref:RNA polymerase sigma factor n=1 Tax=Microbulbifer TaxID=48073 RepID=UPI00035C7DB5|nr:sigma-70 family RNA polymerase sigma factor [Microbulbifer variabilis]
MYTWPKALFHKRSSQEHFSGLVYPYIRTMYRMAYRWTGSRVDAEDLVQDVLSGLLNKVSILEKTERLGPWLVKVLYHRYVDLYRRQCASPIDESFDLQDVESCSDGRSEHCSNLDLERLLNRALLMLGPGWRDVVLLHDVEGYTASEVAEILDINVGTVKSRLHRAHKKLKKIITEGTIGEVHPC